MFTHPHRRYNPLKDEWILVSPQRTQRPWQGRQEGAKGVKKNAYDPDCPLCPGNLRGSGQANAAYEDTFVFDNDFPALISGESGKNFNLDDLLIARSEQGRCRVMCYSPRHDLNWVNLTHQEICRVVATWTQEYLNLGQLPGINHIQIFENKGIAMGASNPHPHCQIWATGSLPVEQAKEIDACRKYLRAKNGCLLCDYLALELRQNERIIVANDSFVVLVPFWATWPFETLLLPRRHMTDLTCMTDREQTDLANILKTLAIRYDNLFETEFPYSMGWHQMPTDGRTYPELHLHAHFYPPLLRSASIRKFMVGYEMLGEPQRDITPEMAAAKLQTLPERHYLE